MSEAWDTQISVEESKAGSILKGTLSRVLHSY